MRKIALALSLIVSGWCGMAQKYSPDLEYDEIRNDPGKAITPLYIGVEPFFTEFNGTSGMVMGWGLYGHYNHKQEQNLMIESRFQTSYYRGFVDGAIISIEPNSGKIHFNDYKPAAHFLWDINASYKLLRWNRMNKPIKIWLSTGGTDINNYIDGARGTKRLQLDARLGFFYKRNALKLTNLPSGAQSFGNGGDAFTNLNSMNLYAGINVSRVWELVVDITELNIGRKVARKHKNIYLDGIFAPALKARQLEANGSTFDLTSQAAFDANGNYTGYLDKASLGFRFGVANKPEFENFLSGWEIGAYPSLKAENTARFFFKIWWVIDAHSSKDL